MHKSNNQLTEKLNKARAKVKVSGLYYHYKKPELAYKVLRLAIMEADDEICVIYEAQYEGKLVFVRPLSSWLDKVDDLGKTLDRFTLIRD